MQVANSQKFNINFGRSLKKEEIQDYSDTLSCAKTQVGQTGKSILIVHDACLPQSDNVNTGVGSLSTKDSSKFFDFAKTYLGTNTIEVLPLGELSTPKPSFCSYGASALSLSNSQINPELLISDEYSNILKKDEFDEIISSNKSTQKNGLVNYENVTLDNSSQDKVIKKAFNRFQKLDNKNPLRQRYCKYISANNDWLEPKCVYKILKKKNGGQDFSCWADESERNLYSLDENTKKAKIKNILKSDKEEAEFFKFKQFIADEHLKKGKDSLNKKGLKLYGDCLIGFSQDEVWSNPKAFKQNYTIGWGLPALNFDTIKDTNSESAKLLKRKVGLAANRYDSIRFDVGWAYVAPIVSPQGQPKNFDRDRKYMGDSVLKMIESEVQDVKNKNGENFSPKDLIWEFDADGNTFRMFDGDKLIQPVKNRTKIYGNTYMHDYNGDVWGSNDAFLKRGWSPDEFIIGVGNHDPQPLRQIADNIPNHVNNRVEYYKAPAADALSKILKIPRQNLDNPSEFAKAKFAEPMMARNNQVFYMDVFGRSETFDSHNFYDGNRYRYKIGSNFVSDYMKAIKEGYGFNPMDALEKVFVARGLDKTEPKLFQRIVKYKHILLEDEPSKPVEPQPKPVLHKTQKIKNKSMIVIGAIVATCIGGVLSFKSSLYGNKKQSSPILPQNKQSQQQNVFSNMHVSNK